MEKVTHRLPRARHCCRNSSSGYWKIDTDAICQLLNVISEGDAHGGSFHHIPPLESISAAGESSWIQAETNPR